MFRKPTSKSIRPKSLHIEPRPPYAIRNNSSGQEVKSLMITIPLEQVHPHNAQNPKVKVDVNKDTDFDPVRQARALRNQAEERNKRAEEAVFVFLKRTKARSLVDKGQSEEELELLKQKFRAASYSSTYGYDYGLLFDKLDDDKSGSINIDEFSTLVKRFCPEITERQLRNLMKAADEDGSGEIDRNEFVDFISPKTEVKVDSEVTMKSSFELEYQERNNKSQEPTELIQAKGLSIGER